MPEQFGTAFLLTQNAGVEYEVMRKCHFYMAIDGIDTLLATQDADPPGHELEQVRLYYYNDHIKLASKPDPGDLTIQVLDFVTPDIVTQLDDWFDQIYNRETRNMGYSSTYKRSGMMHMNDPNGKKKRTLTMKGLFPLNAPVPKGYSYEGGQEVVKIEMKFSCDTCSYKGQSS